MQIVVTSHGEDRAVFALAGRLNMASADRLRGEVAAAITRGEKRIAVDMSEIEFLDSTGLGAIISAFKSVREAGGDVRLVAPSWQAMLVIRLTNMDRVFTIYDSAEEVLADG
jgi:anti-sigma B factor antagonist